MNVIIKSNDDSYFYLYNILNKNNTKYLDNINDVEIENLIIKKIDSLGYINETNIKLEDVLKSNKIKKLFIEQDNIYLNRILKNNNIKHIVIENNKNYLKEMNKLKSIILLKYILDENKQSIYNLKFLILGENDLSVSITNLLKQLNTSYDFYNKNINNINLLKYDIIINTSNFDIDIDLFFNVKKTLIIYDLNYNSRLDKNLLDNVYIKYRYINNVSLYLPIAKANALYEVMCKNDCI